MKRFAVISLIVCALAVLPILKNVDANCTPTFTRQSLPTSIPPGSMGQTVTFTKTDSFNITWPDGHTDNGFPVSSTGQKLYGSQNFCCSPFLSNPECWPIFHGEETGNLTPTDGYFRKPTESNFCFSTTHNCALPGIPSCQPGGSYRSFNECRETPDPIGPNTKLHTCASQGGGGDEGGYTATETLIENTWGNCYAVYEVTYTFSCIAGSCTLINEEWNLLYIYCLAA